MIAFQPIRNDQLQLRIRVGRERNCIMILKARIVYEKSLVGEMFLIQKLKK